MKKAFLPMWWKRDDDDEITLFSCLEKSLEMKKARNDRFAFNFIVMPQKTRRINLSLSRRRKNTFN